VRNILKPLNTQINDRVVLVSYGSNSVWILNINSVVNIGLLMARDKRFCRLIKRIIVPNTISDIRAAYALTAVEKECM
jgi:hypothetical protein